MTLLSRVSRLASIFLRTRSAIRLALLFLVLVCLSLLTLESWSSYAARKAYLNAATTSTNNMARALADHAEASIDLVDIILAGVVERVQNASLGEDPARLQGFLAATVHKSAPVQGLFVFNAQGRPISSALRGTVPTYNTADREYFIYHRTHADRLVHIGSPIVGRSSGIWVIPVSRRIEHPDGSFAGVALATIKLDFFREFYGSFDIGQAGTIFLATNNARLIVRLPFNEKNIGMDISGGPVFQMRKRTGATGSATLVSAFDKVERLYAYRELRAYPLLIAVALSKDEVLARWRTSVYISGAGTLFLMAILLLLGTRVIRQLIEHDRLQQALREAKSALEATNASLQLLALSDSLTGLANRRHFDQRLSVEFKRAMREQSSLALVMIDVDYFKRFNDHYGHVAGDNCLQLAARAVQGGQRRPGDIAARFGGEEFAILLPNTDLQGACAVAEAVRAAIADARFAHAGSPMHIVTVSVGVHAGIPAKGLSSFSLLEAADRSLYQAKAEGRNRVCGAESVASSAGVGPRAT
ncbi:MAG: diguanylate cyclase [Massilia sp.]|nr:diguanylate cyclase [Massilia sp.]